VSKPSPLGKAAPWRATEADVVDYLRRHRDFLDRHPELIAELMPAAHVGSRTVVDLQHYLIGRLRRDLVDTRRAHEEAVTTARGNLASQQRIHAAVLDLMNASSFEHFVESITSELPIKLDLDVVALCVESTRPNQPRPRTGVRLLSVGSIDHFVGRNRALLLRPTAAPARAIYGSGAALIKSDALLRLSIGAEAPVGLLALGSRYPGHFRPGQGTELLLFLARTIESTARAWLDLPG
jgi:uncharacterized protein YigA (DUF484 family)